MGQVWDLIVTIWGWLMDNLLLINLVLSIVIVFFQRKDPRSVLIWLLVLYFMPIVGFLLYLVLCQDYRKSKMFHVKELEDRRSQLIEGRDEVLKAAMDYLKDSPWQDYESLVRYNLETTDAVLTVDNSVDIFTDGAEKFADLKEELKRAQKYIHIQYYIIRNDEVFQSIMPILEERAAHGVEVRLLYDGMGSRFVPKKVWKRLEAAGIRVAAFFPPLLGWLHLRINYRNHRKIVVIDGRVGYVGGFNIGKEYISHDPQIGYWRDTHLKIRGGAVLSLQIRFALDWNYASKENLFKDRRYFEMPAALAGVEREAAEAAGVPGDVGAPAAGAVCEAAESAAGSPAGGENGWSGWPAKADQIVRQIMSGHQVMMQIIVSGPDAQHRQIRNNYLQMIHRANDHVYVQTPYFIPDDTVLSALKFAAESGVDVRLMIPCKPDHPIVYWATYSYMGDLLQAGARCYTYENGFLHAKGVMVDGLVSCYGTANMDIRSFELNFEVNATIYDQEVTGRLERIFLEDMKQCKEVTRESYSQRSLWIRFREQCCRLFSPLL